ncbi:CBS domain-containing protein [Methanomassiliicoccus luminyensis]|uniref:CBS domain-containing protein n=1 Tax=Methanomassiliicoccus luminyensis TaxID=1080712 RepID=UPI0003669842|nr:CBS domain-containing protein [Methanomassiliicoccus luminyensis]
MVETVKDYMIPKEEVVTPDDSVTAAIDLMVERDSGSVIVVDREEKRRGRWASSPSGTCSATLGYIKPSS